MTDYHNIVYWTETLSTLMVKEKSQKLSKRKIQTSKDVPDF